MEDLKKVDVNNLFTTCTLDHDIFHINDGAEGLIDWFNDYEEKETAVTKE
ncbi:hypothetical protein [Enterococcus sp. AZ072]